MSTPEQVSAVLVEALDASGVLLEEVTISPAGRRRVVRVLIDTDLAERAESVTDTIPPISLDDVAAATRTVSQALDASDVLGDAPYTLEVSSPGVSRPLTAPRHFRRNVGRLVRLTGPELSVEGRLRAADGAGVTIAPAEPADAPEQVISYNDITRGQVQVEFNRPDESADKE